MTDNNKNSEFDIDYFSFKNDEFYEWAATAPTSNLVEALFCYFQVLEVGIESVAKEADFTDPDILDGLHDVAWNFYDCGPWIMEIQEQVFRRNDPTGLPEAARTVDLSHKLQVANDD
jgi:hypothetical protein